MATYAKEKGFTVQTLSTDPVASQALGGSWSSGGNLNTARGRPAGGGTQTAGLIAGGAAGGSYTRQAVTEQYNGSAWTEVNDMNTARTWSGDAGTYTSAIIGGGHPGAGGTFPNNTESWDGSNWTETTEINTVRIPGGAASESNTASLIFGGFITPSRNAETELWNGSTWTEKNDMNQSKDEMASAGTTTAALSAGGTPVKSNVELWDGTSWTETTDLNTAKTGAVGAGLSTDAIVYGGSTPTYVATTEFWNGTSWTELNDMSTARFLGAPAGTSAAALMSGGDPGPSTIGTDATEEWSAPAVFGKQVDGQLFYNSTSNAFKVTEFNIPGATWASGGSLPTVKSAHGYAGTQTAGVAFAGATSTTNKVATSYEYNGSAWSDANSVNTTRDLCAGAGTQTAAILFGGTLPPGGHSNATELYDGTNWTTSPGTFNSQARSRIGPIGTQTAALAVSGTPISPVDKAVESWNGSSWTEIAEFNTSRINGGAAGIQTAGLFFGGEDPLRALTESWDGTAWTEVADLNTARQSSGMGAGDSNTSAICIGGEVSPGFTANTESWNGSSWTEVANLAQARGYLACGGTPTSAIATGGRNPGSSFLANTEEFTAGLSNFTITSS
jgi:hypothetical protein